jgi:arylsulfatase A-like enzyme
VLLLGLDTYRADRWTSRPAGAPSLTPALDRLAMESDVWLDAYSTFNNTNPSFTSIHTGLYGRSHGIYDLVTALPGEHVTLAERFDAAGYATLAVFAASHLRPAVSGLGQGFDDVRQPEQHSVSSAGMVVDRALEWIDGRREPFFAWLHLFDVHTPTLPPEPYASGWRAAGPQGLEPVDRWRAFRTPGPRDFLIPAVGGHPDLYDGEAAYLDRQLDRLLGFLASRGLLERTFVVVVADHGESLGEHDLLHTHVGLYEPSVHVPLVVRWPDGLAPRGAAPGAPRGRTFRGLVQTVDLYPSLLAAAGLVAPGDAAAGTEGGDLWEWSGTGPGGDGEPGRGLVIAEHANGTGAMIRTRRYKYIWMYPNPHLATGPYLFDLAADPGEETNLAGRGLAVEGRLAAALEAWRQGGGGPATTRRTPGDEELRSLRALGYVD